MPTRDFVRRVFAATAVMLVCAGSQAGAQTYPANKITLIVAFAPGGIADTLARLIGQGLSDRLHQSRGGREPRRRRRQYRRGQRGARRA